MVSHKRMLLISLISTIWIPAQALAQSPTPPAGVFDIPPGFDFPADKTLLEQYRVQANVAAQRVHLWNVFAGLGQPTPDAKHAIFETWFAESETFDAGSNIATLAARARTVPAPRFKVPDQFRKRFASLAAAAGGGDAVLSFVLYNFPAYNHVRDKRLYLQSELNQLLQNGAFDRKIPQNRTVPEFPANAVVLKTVWWPVAKDQVSAMPIWDPESNPARPTGNPVNTWARYVGVDPTRATVPPGETADIKFNGSVKPGSHIVGLKDFHAIELTAEQVNGVNSDGLMAQVAQASFGRPLAVGDYAVLVALHITTKEIDDWVWGTLWWHDKPDDGPFAENRPGSLAKPWRSYLMNAAYDLNLPKEKDGGPHVTFDPWLEAKFEDGGGHGGGVVSNCMNCHNRASSGADDFKPIYRGDPDLAKDGAYAPGSLRTDFLWSILFSAKPN
jgi:hypothetical protein